MARSQELRIRRKPTKQGRLEARIALEQKRIIERAAKIRGISVTDFILASTQRAAAETIRDFEMLSLHDDAREAFVNALLYPPAPNAAARAAAQRYKKRVRL